jgi:hypothetical protein
MVKSKLGYYQKEGMMSYGLRIINDGSRMELEE